MGRGLDSLIPEKDESPKEEPVLDVLSAQSRLHEPVHHFYDEAPRIVAASSDVPTPRPPSDALPPTRSDIRERRSESIFWIEVSKIEPNPYQPRRTFAVDELTSLADSIREHGVLQPLLVTKIAIDSPRGLDVTYQLISGERRWRAAKLAGLREVPVMIREAETPEREKLELALIENVQREDLNPLERARAFERLVGEFGLMQKEVAERIGKSREVVANALRLLRLPQEMQTAIASNAITEGHARALLMLENNPSEQVKLFSQIRTANITVRDAELAARATGGAALRRPRRTRASRLDPDLRDLQQRLEEAFGTRVSLVKKGDHGKIILEFYSNEELQGILDRIAKRGQDYV